MKLPPRISDALERPDDEARVHAAWEGTRARMAARGQRPALAPKAVAALAMAAAVALAALWGTSRPEPHEPEIAAGPLFLEDGRALVAAEAVAAPRALVLSDRSRIELAPGARVVPRANDGARVELALERGHARFEVTPGGPRAWRVACGPVDVRVVGTAFVVERDATRVHVEVEHGRVRVEGEPVPGGARTLGAGDVLDVVLSEPDAVVAEPRELAPAAEPPHEEPAPPPAAPARAPDWRSMAEVGSHDAAYDALEGAAGLAAEAERASPRELMLLADVARLSGHPRDAVAPLERMLAAHADAAEAPLAAITLARIELGPLARPARAAAAYERALALGVPSAFDAEVCSGLALARSRSGDPEGAAAMARACLARHAEPPSAAALRALAP